MFREQLGGLRAVTESPTSGLPSPPPGSPRLFMTPGYQVPLDRAQARHRRAEALTLHRLHRACLAPRRQARRRRLAQGAPPRRRHGRRPDGAGADAVRVVRRPGHRARRRPLPRRRRRPLDHDSRPARPPSRSCATPAWPARTVRVGHADDGKLIAAIYDKGDRPRPCRPRDRRRSAERTPQPARE